MLRVRNKAVAAVTAMMSVNALEASLAGLGTS